MNNKKVIIGLITILVAGIFNSLQASDISGELKQWHKITFTFNGPEVSETDEFNPFTNYRLDVNFTHSETGKTYRIPGYFAANGNAANTSADNGNKWRVHFSPDETGEWSYRVSFRKGKYIVASEKENAGEPAGYMDGEKGNFSVKASDKSGLDFRAKGRLQYVGSHYLQFAGSGEFFLKAGADAPENLLAYADFDGDFKTDGRKDELVKTWAPHINDWKEGDPTWKNGKGKGLIGAVNYLVSKGMNAMSFLPMNIEGDDRNVFPYTRYEERLRMDVSKLDQWEIVFEHAQQNGIFLHFKTQEAENQKLLDGGDLGVERTLYYRELIARFGHHLALNWNLGEENGTWGKNVKGQNAEQRRAMAQYFYENDPYHHHVVIHNGEWYDDLFGNQSKLTGASMQTHKPDFSRVHQMTLDLYNSSEKTGKTWAIACDEPGDAQHALLPDQENPDHDNARRNALWGNLLAGGWGVEWYFGYKHDHSDLTCEDWRSRDNMWEQSRHALVFFRNYQVPFWTMRPSDELSHSGNWILASEPQRKPFYAVVQVKPGEECIVDLPENEFEYGWLNPKTGDGLKTLLEKGKVTGKNKTGFPVPDHTNDWILLVASHGKLASNPDAKMRPERDPLKQPFAQKSIWNMPIGSGAKYVHARIQKSTERGMTIDEDVIVLKPDAPETKIYNHFAGWDRNKDRCKKEGELLFSAPIPSDFVVSPETWDGATPNSGLAVLMPDKKTIKQTQPFSRCQAGKYATSQYVPDDQNLYGDGYYGAHGGSRLSAIGGALQVGELTSESGPINHVLKVNLDSRANLFYDEVTKGFRWPAKAADSGASKYYDSIRTAPTVKECLMGALLALPPWLDLDSLGFETQPGRMLAEAFRDYGAYVVDGTGWSVYALITEWSPDGRVLDEFDGNWGFSIKEPEKDTPLGRDMDRIFLNLHVVDNNSDTTIGGGGVLRAPLATPLD